jgi:hypothetical protein
MVADMTAQYPSLYFRRYLEGKHFDWICKYKSVSGYPNNSNLPENRYIRNWLIEEGLDVGDYSFARGDTHTSFNATSKYSRDSPTYNMAAFNKAWRMVAQSWSVCQGARLAFDYMDYFDLQTSPGYPYSLFYQTKEKALAEEEIRQHVDDCFWGFKFDGIWTTRCKKEPKKKSKILSHNSRVILANPMNTQAAGIRLFGPMNLRIYELARKHMIPCTVGLSKFYKGWHYLYLRLKRGNLFKRGLELDYAGFDGSCSIEEFTQVMNIRFNLLDAKLQTAEVLSAMQRYYAEVVHTRILMDTGELIRKHTGNPSGQINTILDNCMINEFRWYYAWCLITEESMHNLDDFRRYCELVTCGDDSLLTVHPEIEDVFTPHKIFNIFKDHGWEPKFGLTTGWQPVETLSYCSQHFKWMYGYVVPVPNNKEKLMASLLYGGNKRNVRETLGRLLGVKIESYFLTGFRSALDRLISELFERHFLSLRQPADKNEFSYNELLILNRDFVSAYSLYLDESEHTAHVSAGPVPRFSDDHIQDI